MQTVCAGDRVMQRQRTTDSKASMCFIHRPTYRRAGQARLQKVELTPPARAPRLPVATHWARSRDVGTTSITPLALVRRRHRDRHHGGDFAPSF
jgi:hypothetical protein